MAMSVDHEIYSSKVLDSTLDELATAAQAIELSVVMPCLNERETVAVCIRKAMVALRDAGIPGEVIVADNGSTDGSVEIAQVTARPTARCATSRETIIADPA